MEFWPYAINIEQGVGNSVPPFHPIWSTWLLSCIHMWLCVVEVDGSEMFDTGSKVTIVIIIFSVCHSNVIPAASVQPFYNINVSNHHNELLKYWLLTINGSGSSASIDFTLHFIIALFINPTLFVIYAMTRLVQWHTWLSHTQLCI